MNKFKQLKNELKALGINEANMSEGTVDGTPAVFLTKDGKEAQYTGYSEGDVMSGHADKKNSWLKQKFS